MSIETLTVLLVMNVTMLVVSATVNAMQCIMIMKEIRGKKNA